MTDSFPAKAGTVLPPVTVQVTRATLVRYAGASTDFNPIHYSDRAATELGLDGVIAHGMLTMGMALRVVTDWIGDPARVASYSVRFTRPVRVPDTAEGVTVQFTGVVKQIVGPSRVQTAVVAIDAVCDGNKVLGAAVAEVRLD